MELTYELSPRQQGTALWLERQEAQPAAALAAKPGAKTEGEMLWTIAVILLVLWALGLMTSYTAGGFVHVLLIIAVIVVVFQFISGRRSV
jgi:predicted ferric reductase